MKSFYKAMAVLSAVLIVVGVAISIGVASTGLEYLDTNFSMFMDKRINYPVNEELLVVEENKNASSSVPTSPATSEQITSQPVASGITSGNSGGAASTAPTDPLAATVPSSYQIKGLDFEFDFADVEIKSGDDFSISYDKNSYKNVYSKINYGIWELSTSHKNNRFINNSEKIIITIPRDFVATELSIEIGAGKLDAVNVNSHISDISVGAGEIIMSESNIANAEISVGMGNFYFDGVLTGKGSLECGVGNLTVLSTGNPNDYGYSIDAGIGAVNALGDKYKGITSSPGKNVSAPNFYEIECGIGNIDFTVNN